MALSKSDLEKIDNLIVKRVSGIIQSETEPINNRLDSLEKGQSNLSNRMLSLEKGQTNLGNRMISLEKGQKRIEKKLDKSTDFLDRQILRNNKRLKRLENHLDLPTPEFD